MLGAAAYLMWGLFPLYFPLLEPAGATEILAHRVFWSLVTMLVLILAVRRWGQLRRLLDDRRTVAILSGAAVVIAVNWGTYIWGVNNGHVVETSLGYFINPLVTVLLGVAVLGERLRPLQWAALGLAGVAVVGLTVEYGRPPWVAIVLAFSFGTYGLAKKKADTGAIESLTFETMVLAPVALGYLVLLGATGAATFTDRGGVARRAPRRHGRHHRRTADLLRRRRHPGVDDDAGAAAVRHPDPAVRPRRSWSSTSRCRRCAGWASAWSGWRWWSSRPSRSRTGGGSCASRWRPRPSDDPSGPVHRRFTCCTPAPRRDFLASAANTTAYSRTRSAR